MRDIKHQGVSANVSYSEVWDLPMNQSNLIPQYNNSIGIWNTVNLDLTLLAWTISFSVGIL